MLATTRFSNQWSRRVSAALTRRLSPGNTCATRVHGSRLSILLLPLLAVALAAPVSADWYPRKLDEPSQGTFLVATRQLTGSGFSETVILLLTHSDEGTVGLVINRPSELPLRRELPQGGQPRQTHLLMGGPVALNSVRALVRTQANNDAGRKVMDGVMFTNDMDVLAEMAASDAEANIRYFVGYSGWSPGQLDAEIEYGSWHIVTADVDTVFAQKVDDIWPRIMRRLEAQWVRVNPDLIDCEIGHESLDRSRRRDTG